MYERMDYAESGGVDGRGIYDSKVPMVILTQW